jgi:type I restriction enzyme M protein
MVSMQYTMKAKHRSPRVRKLKTPESVNSVVKSICDIMRRSNCAGAGVKTNLLFFNKGRPTELIWYCDLSDIKVGKKSPLPRAHFDDFLKILPTRGIGPRSWTVDFTDRLQQALEEARPLRDKAAVLQVAAEDLEEALRLKRQERAPDRAGIEELEARWKSTLRER